MPLDCVGPAADDRPTPSRAGESSAGFRGATLELVRASRRLTSARSTGGEGYRVEIDGLRSPLPAPAGGVMTRTAPPTPSSFAVGELLPALPAQRIAHSIWFS
jgi:hypothetical protein